MQGVLGNHRLSYIAFLSETCPKQGRGRRKRPTGNGSTFPTYPTDPHRLTPVTGKGTDTTTTQHEKTCSSFTCAEARCNEQIDTRNTGSFNHKRVWLLRAHSQIDLKTKFTNLRTLSNFLHVTQHENFACISLFNYRRKVNGLTAHAEQSRSSRVVPRGARRLQTSLLCDSIH